MMMIIFPLLFYTASEKVTRIVFPGMDTEASRAKAGENSSFRALKMQS